MLEIIIPQYLTHVQLTKGRRPKYYTKGTHIPKKYNKYKEYDSKNRLLNFNKVPIVANPASVNKPRIKKINGQELYSGNMPPHMRSKVVSVIKQHFSDHLCKCNPLIDFPIAITAELFTIPGAMNWDLDNQWIYHKCFQDALVDAKIIPDDNIFYVTQAPAFSYTPVERMEDRKLIYRINKDDRQIFKEHPSYKAHLSSKQILLEKNSPNSLLDID
mgnify:CR=1 FL=1|jgi:Holliday junction resolvase RusA-like endonuclease